MYEVLYYRTISGEMPVMDYIDSLAVKTDKDSQIKYRKIREYIRVLEARGQSAGQPYIKHIDGDLWELRPLRDRIFFVAWDGNRFVLLHHFMKQTQKTPQKEINQAKRNLADLKERTKSDEQK